MRVHLRADACQGHARCNAVAPEVFEVDDDGYVLVGQDGLVPAQLEASAARGVAACPEQALSLSAPAATPSEAS